MKEKLRCSECGVNLNEENAVEFEGNVYCDDCLMEKTVVCMNCNERYKRDNSLIIPAGLHTIYFEYRTDAILKIVNEELNCDFTDVIITADTFGFDKMNEPICGSI